MSKVNRKAYAAGFTSVAGDVHEVAVSDVEVVVLGSPPENDDEETGHNCDGKGCGWDHVLWRGKRADNGAELTALRERCERLEAVIALAANQVAAVQDEIDNLDGENDQYDRLYRLARNAMDLLYPTADAGGTNG